MRLFTRRVGCRVLLIVAGVIVIALALTWLYSERIVDRSILTDSPCAAPCWQGIVPGTSMEEEEIIRILETLPYVDMGSVRRDSLPKGRAISWGWNHWPWRRTGYNWVFLIGGVVHDISLSVDFDLTVEEILDKYGLPEATNAVQAGVPEYPYVAMNLLYPTQGLWFTAKVLPWHQPVLEPTTRIFEVMYTTPAESLESWLGPDIHTMHLQPWPGYGELEEVFDPHSP